MREPAAGARACGLQAVVNGDSEGGEGWGVGSFDGGNYTAVFKFPYDERFSFRLGSGPSTTAAISFFIVAAFLAYD